jgi:hypothetical protein
LPVPPQRGDVDRQRGGVALSWATFGGPLTGFAAVVVRALGR